jgi:hypothetical protein
MDVLHTERGSHSKAEHKQVITVWGGDQLPEGRLVAQVDEAPS